MRAILIVIVSISFVFATNALQASDTPSSIRAASIASSTRTGKVGIVGPTAHGKKVLPSTLPPASHRPPSAVQRAYPISHTSFVQLKTKVDREAAIRARFSGTEHRPTKRITNAAKLSTTFTALDYLGTGKAYSSPDGAIAVGPSTEIAAVDSSFAVYNRSGSKLLGPVSFQSFFGVTDAILNLHVLYDAGNTASGGYGGGKGRFVMVAMTRNNAARTSNYTLAVSQNDNPGSATTGWCTYLINGVQRPGPSATYADFPTLGMDGDSLYVASNQVSFTDGQVYNSRLLVIPKQSVYPDASSGSCPTATSTDFPQMYNPDGSHTFTMQPANEPDALPGTGTGTMYIVNATWPSGSRLALRTVETRQGQYTLTSPMWVSVAPYTMPASAPQPGGASINSDDVSLRSAVYRGGTIYTANTTGTVSGSVAPNPFASVQWYEFTPGASTAVTHTVTDPNVAFYMPSISAGCTTPTVPCATAYAALQITGSGPSIAASAFSATGDGTPALFKQGVAGYSLTTDWGHFSSVAPDSTDPTSVWMIGQYAAAPNDWGTAVAALAYIASGNPTPTPTPTSTPTIGPLPASAYSSAVTADKPLLYYRLDESSGTTANDSSGNGRNGTYRSNAQFNQPGATADGDSAIATNGQVVRYTAGTGLPTGSAARSLETWFKTSTAGSNAVLAAWGTEAGTNLFALMMFDTTHLKVTSWSGDYFFALPPGGSLNDGKWHHVVATFDGTTLIVYYDGSAIGSQPASFTTLVDGNGLVLGSSTSGNYGYTGALDETAVYDSALPLARVQAHFQAASTPNPTATPTSTPSAPTPTPTPQGPLSQYAKAILADKPALYYGLDESGGTTAFDSSHNGRNGTYTPNAVFNAPGATSSGDTAIAGSGEVVRYPAGVGLPGASSARSVELWFRTSTQQNNAVLTAWGSESNTNLFAVMIYNARTMKVSSWAGDYFFTLPSIMNPFDGRWHYVAATFTGTRLTYYFDGVSLGSQSASFTTQLDPNGFVVGSSTSSNYTFTGAVDDVAVYSTVLSATQVQTHICAAIFSSSGGSGGCCGGGGGGGDGNCGGS